MTVATQSIAPRGLKRKIHQEFYNFLPKYEKQLAEYKKAILPDLEQRYSKKGKKGDLEEEPQHWPYMPDTNELKYQLWVDKVVNEKTKKFYPQKDEETNRAIPDTGAYRTIRSIVRIKRPDDSEYLITKQDLHGWDRRGDAPVNLFVTYPEVWTKQKFAYRIQYDERRGEEEKIPEGPSEAELIYEIPFSKEALKDLYDQRQDDRTIQFVVKEEATGKAVLVQDLSGSTAKSFELFRDNSWENLFKGNYIPAAIKQELRSEAVAQGLIQGGAADYSNTASNQTNTKIYK